jgi:hypothetical protein
MSHEKTTVEAAERYLSRQPVHQRDSAGHPLWNRNQILRAFCAGQVAVIEEDTPAPAIQIVFPSKEEIRRLAALALEEMQEKATTDSEAWVASYEKVIMSYRRLALSKQQLADRATPPTQDALTPNERFEAAMQSVRERDTERGYPPRSDSELRSAAHEILMLQDRKAAPVPLMLGREGADDQHNHDERGESGIDFQLGLIDPKDDDFTLQRRAERLRFQNSLPVGLDERDSTSDQPMVSVFNFPPGIQSSNSFQDRVQPWLMVCFGETVAGDREERNHRFLEEALELVQSTGCTIHEAHQLVDYVYGRPIGEPRQEVGGVMVTLAALCLANALDMHQAAEAELARIWTKVEQIRGKQAAKPKHSPLPGPTASEGSADA